MLTSFQLLWKFCWTSFLGILENLVVLFLSDFAYFIHLCGLFGHFLGVFGLVSQVICPEIRLCAKNSGPCLKTLFFCVF